MGPRLQCYIPSHKVIGPLVLEKIFEGFLPYMGVAAILAMWLRCPEQTFVPPTHGGCNWNLASIGLAVLEKKIFENGGRTRDGQGTDDGACLYNKLTNEPKGSGEVIKLITLLLKPGQALTGFCIRCYASNEIHLFAMCTWCFHYVRLSIP